MSYIIYMKKMLISLLFPVCLLLNTSFVYARYEGSGLREGEKKFLERVKEKKQSSSKNNLADDAKKYELCQTALTKIDKLTIEVNALKQQSDLEKNAQKIKYLELQIKRYRIQAKDMCSKEILQDSVHFK